MKTKLIFLLPALLWILTGCEPSKSEGGATTLKVSDTSFKNLSAGGQTITINVQSNGSWDVSSNNPWCTTDRTSGEEDDRLYIEIGANNDPYARAATITINAGSKQEKVVLVQQGKQLSAQEIENHRYRIPVVFQVLYADASNETQNVRGSRLSDIITACNKYYANQIGSNSLDMDVEFVLATHDPEGNLLPEPGIHRTQVDNATAGCDEFMENKENLKYMWDLNRYINIVLFTFTEENVLGISYIPYTLKGNALEGVTQITFWPEQSDLSHPRCLSINNTYIYGERSIEDQYYNSRDVIPTITHELGHYLGLLHAYNEKELADGTFVTDICEDTDYCEDTPPYNRDLYMAAAIEHGIEDSDDILLFMHRENCETGEITTPNNVMDYEISWSNRFTPDQKERVRHVLTYSPLIPGPKIGRPTTRTVARPEELVMQIMR